MGALVPQVGFVNIAGGQFWYSSMKMRSGLKNIRSGRTLYLPNGMRLCSDLKMFLFNSSFTYFAAVSLVVIAPGPGQHLTIGRGLRKVP